MWKLLKTELSYYSIPLKLLFLLIIILMMKEYYHYLEYEKLYLCSVKFYKAINMIYIVSYYYLLFVFISLFVELKEGRAGQISSLPLPMSTVSFYRIINALVIELLFYLLLIIFIVSSGKLGDIITGLYIKRIVYKTIYYFWITLGIAYFIKLFSEWQGRIIFFSGILLISVYSYLSNNYLYDRDFNQFVDGLYTIKYVKILVLLLPLIFAALTHWFFMIRRSYLQ
jgi:hypothetical protein